jgi:hypothetical protein
MAPSIAAIQLEAAGLPKGEMRRFFEEIFGAT